MNGALKPWQHAALSLSILLAGLALAYLVLVAPAIASRQAFQEELDDLRFQYARFNQSLEQIDAIRADLAELRERRVDEAGFLDEKPRALAAADLQRHLNDLIANSGGNLISTQVVPERNDEAVFPDITIQVHLRADIESLQKILYRFKMSDPVLILDQFHIQARNAGRRREARTGNDPLDVRVAVTGFIYQSVGT